jgi:hypothetical protein
MAADYKRGRGILAAYATPCDGSTVVRTAAAAADKMLRDRGLTWGDVIALEG